MIQKLLIAITVAVSALSADAKPVHWKSRSAAMKKTKTPEIKVLWKKAMIANKAFKVEKVPVKKAELDKARLKLFVELDGMLAQENPNYKKLVDAANK